MFVFGCVSRESSWFQHVFTKWWHFGVFLAFRLVSKRFLWTHGNLKILCWTTNFSRRSVLLGSCFQNSATQTKPPFPPPPFRPRSPVCLRKRWTKRPKKNRWGFGPVEANKPPNLKKTLSGLAFNRFTLSLGIAALVDNPQNFHQRTVQDRNIAPTQRRHSAPNGHLESGQQ